jgi:hypothetical protein
MLELDRCVEEDERLWVEAKALADWVLEEVEVAGRAFENAGEQQTSTFVYGRFAYFGT